MKKPLLFGTLLAAASFAFPLTAATSTHAQAAAPVTPAPPAPSAPAAAEQTVTLDVRDAPVRQVLTQLFDKVKVDYSLDNNVQGFVTLKVTDQPFETVLRLVLRSASAPLTYSRTSGIYEVKPRLVQAISPSAPPALTANEPGAALASSGGDPHLAVIELTYLDPYDIAPLLGIVLVPNGSRFDRGTAAGGSSAPASPSGGANGSGLLGSGGGSAGIGTVGRNGTGGRIITGGN